MFLHYIWLTLRHFQMSPRAFKASAPPIGSEFAWLVCVAQYRTCSLQKKFCVNLSKEGKKLSGKKKIYIYQREGTLRRPSPDRAAFLRGARGGGASASHGASLGLSSNRKPPLPMPEPRGPAVVVRQQGEAAGSQPE